MTKIKITEQINESLINTISKKDGKAEYGTRFLQHIYYLRKKGVEVIEANGVYSILVKPTRKKRVSKKKAAVKVQKEETPKRTRRKKTSLQAKPVELTATFDPFKKARIAKKPVLKMTVTPKKEAVQPKIKSKLNNEKYRTQFEQEVQNLNNMPWVSSVIVPGRFAIHRV